MEITKDLTGIITEATKSIDKVLNDNAIKTIQAKSNELISHIEKDAYIKIPFIGDFNAGKSSLLNCFIGRHGFLPTNIRPKTAVSYELYYSTNESLELFHDGVSKKNAPLSAISELDVVPGDIVKVNINNQKIKELNDKGIVLVDMPGIDSGIEAHNNAILNYIQEGTIFMIVVDAEQGTLRNSTIDFIKEIKQYSLSANVLISKCDKKPESELTAIKKHIEEVATNAFGTNITAGITSSASDNIKDLENILDNIQTEEVIRKKYKASIEAFIEAIISELSTQAKLLLSNKKDYDEKLKQLQDKKQQVISEITEKGKNGQSVEDSVDDILNDIREALIQNSTKLANTILTNQNDKNIINNAVLTIIRPVLINSINREVSEYQDAIGECVKNFSIDMDNILNTSTDDALDTIINTTTGMLSKKTIEAFLSKTLATLMTRFAGYKALTTILATISRLISPITIILINILPDLIRMIFGQNNEKRIEQIKNKLEFGIFDKIVEELRPTITEIIEQQQELIRQQMNTLIEDEVEKVNQNIISLKQEKERDNENKVQQIQQIQEVTNRLTQLLQTI